MDLCSGVFRLGLASVRDCAVPPAGDLNYIASCASAMVERALSFMRKSLFGRVSGLWSFWVGSGRFAKGYLVVFGVVTR